MFLRSCFLLVCLGTSFLGAQDFNKLPAWARPHAVAAQSESIPGGDPDAWVLFERREVAYGGDNEVWTHRFRLVKVLGEKGISEGTFALHGLGGKATKVKKLKGWNLRPDGELVKLETDDVVTLEDAGDETFSRTTLTAASLSRVAKGSWVAFESLEKSRFPFGPLDGMPILQRHPVRLLEFEPGKREGWFTNLAQVDLKMDLFHFGELVPAPAAFDGKSLRFSNLPALPEEEQGHPHAFNFLPIVGVRFIDPKLTEAPVWDSWDRPASWFAVRYGVKAAPAPGVPPGGNGIKGLQSLWSWMGRELTYKAVYLTPERGWLPESPAEVARKRYGDCKDLACFFMAQASQAGFKGYAALARIGEGRIEGTEVPQNSFNHVIAAIRLDASLGLPAEVQTPKGRFLLVDATDPFTPLGRLGGAHRGGRVMICLPEGAEWVDIPDGAVVPHRVETTFEGEAPGEGLLKGTLTFKETGDAWDLRSLAKHQGKEGLRKHLLSSILYLPATGTLEIATFSDPMDLEHPFEVVATLNHPSGFRMGGGEFTLATLGWPAVPGVIQKPGVPRMLPVARFNHDILSFRAKVKVAQRVTPVLKEKTLKTPFREASWKADATDEGAGTLLTLSLDHREIPVAFPYAQREQGLQEWKKDRNAARNLVNDALAFKPGQ